MPQQPKITGDIEVDSWALQVTQELNDVEREVAAAAATPIVTEYEAFRVNGVALADPVIPLWTGFTYNPGGAGVQSIDLTGQTSDIIASMVITPPAPGTYAVTVTGTGPINAGSNGRIVAGASGLPLVMPPPNQPTGGLVWVSGVAQNIVVAARQSIYITWHGNAAGQGSNITKSVSIPGTEVETITGLTFRRGSNLAFTIPEVRFGAVANFNSTAGVNRITIRDPDGDRTLGPGVFDAGVYLLIPSGTGTFPEDNLSIAFVDLGDQTGRV